MRINSCKITSSSVIMTKDMVQVTRRDQKEANENIIRRFNRRVLQSGVLAGKVGDAVCEAYFQG